MTGFLLESATSIRRLLVRREVSAREVVEASLRRVEEKNGEINAVVTLDPRALDEATALDQRLARGEPAGPLHGLPVGIKDVTPVGGLRTTYGSPLYADHVPAEDAEVVRRLRAAGAIVLGKTNTPEFATGANTWNEVFGRTRNPWNPERSAGGSTGGGAAALAAGMIALAEGTDLGGSLRIPAAFCGVVGLRPSPGLVPTSPADYLWDTLQVTGPIARRAEDVALVLQAMAGPSSRAPLAQPIAGRDFVAAVASADCRGWRVAYVPDVARIGIDPAVESVCRAAAFELRQAGATVEESDLDLEYAKDSFITLRGYWMIAQHHTRLDRRHRFGDNLRGNVERALGPRHARAGRSRAPPRPSLGRSAPRLRALRSPAHAHRRGAAVPGDAELSRHHRRPADEDLHRLDRADLRAVAGRPAHRLGARRSRSRRSPRRPADRRSTARGREGPGSGATDPGSAPDRSAAFRECSHGRGEVEQLAPIQPSAG